MSETTLEDLQEMQYLVQHQIASFQIELQDSVKRYITIPQNDVHKGRLFGETFYLNEVLGYLREQQSLIGRYMRHLDDEGPNQEWDRKVFWDYPGDGGLRQKCEEMIKDPFFQHLWKKELHYLIRSSLLSKQNQTKQQKNPQNLVQVKDQS